MPSQFEPLGARRPRHRRPPGLSGPESPAPRPPDDDSGSTERSSTSRPNHALQTSVSAVAKAGKQARWLAWFRRPPTHNVAAVVVHGARDVVPAVRAAQPSGSPGTGRNSFCNKLQPRSPSDGER